MRLLGLLAFVATRGLSRSRLTTALLVLAVTAGVGMQIPNTANLLGYTQTMFEEATTRGFGDVRVEDPHEAVFDDGDVLAERLATVPGVRAAVPIVTFPAGLGTNGKQIVCELHGVDPRGRARDPAVGDRAIVSGVDLALSAGESVALVGPSGCGKTTLLQMLGLLDRPDEGVIKLGPDDVWSITGTERAGRRLERIGFVFQQHNLFDSMTALENVALPCWRKTGSRARANQRAAELLDRFGLARVSGTRASELSGGEAQRTAVARALVNTPAIVLADEPTGNLDSASSQTVIASLFDVCAGGAALLIATHDVEIASRAARQLRMLDGRLVRPSHAPPL